MQSSFVFVYNPSFCLEIVKNKRGMATSTIVTAPAIDEMIMEAAPPATTPATIEPKAQ